MNKDVLYIEPEDDITDIITKIENAKSKIVALVPPKKAGVFRSIVNIKLITKAGTSAEKTIVLVTTDPSIKKLAAATKLPVAKNLQTAPVIPKADAEDSVNDNNSEEPSEQSSIEDEEEEENKEPSEQGEDEADSNDDEEEEEDTKAKVKDKKERSGLKVKNTTNKFILWIMAHKKLAILSGIGIIILIIFLIWAFIIAPSVTVTVDIKTNSNNFSQYVSFTTKLEEEDIETGKLYLQEKKLESSQEVKFEATGKKNIGEKAHGNVEIYAYFPLNLKASTKVNEGDTFSISGLTYVATKTVTLDYSGQGKEECVNKTNAEGLVDYGCRINGKVPVTASESGERFNIAASSTGWDTNARVFAYSDEAMSGGTDEEITIVTQADIDKAKTELAAADQEKSKEALKEDIGEDNMMIDSSFKVKTSDAVSTPAVGEEVKEGVTPTLKATTIASVFILDKTKVDEFITKKADLGESQKIYEMKNPFIESFMESDSGYTGKLKTSYATGPKITENDVIEKIKGKGLGEAQHDLRDIDGISSVSIDKSLPWVTTIPGDPNKITIIFNVKDQNGNEIKPVKEDDKTESSKEDNKDEETSAEKSEK